MALKTQLTILLSLLVAVAGSAQAQPGATPVGRTVMPVVKRLEVLKTAAQVVAVKETTWREAVATATDPFWRSTAGVAVDPAAAAAELAARRAKQTDLDVLTAAAGQIRPTGTMQGPNADWFLLVDGRRLRISDEISVTIEGLLYKVVLSSIERNSYTLKLNDHELQREFK